MHLLWTSENRNRAEAIWYNSGEIESVLLSKRGLNISGAVFNFKLENYQECTCKVEFLKPGNALKILQNLDSVTDLNDSVSVRRFARAVKPELDPLLLQRHGF